MIYKVALMCHRPRTQRIGADSVDREIEILDWSYFSGPWEVAAASAVRALNSIRVYQVNERELFNHQTQLNEEYYVKIYWDDQE